jgi:hypothetical protein
MPRRSLQKSENQVLEAAFDETLKSPKKGQKTGRVQEAEVKKSPTKSTKKGLKTEIIEQGSKSEESEDSFKIKINRVKAIAVTKDESISKPNKGKRKAKSADDDADVGEKEVTKKRKTKGDKEAETMPLAARTPVVGLKKAMYIGAHVSGAGGMFSRSPHFFYQELIIILIQVFRILSRTHFRSVAMLSRSSSNLNENGPVLLSDQKLAISSRRSALNTSTTQRNMSYLTVLI